MRLTYIFGLAALILTFCCNTLLFGQPKAIFEHFSTEQGLSHDLISCMVKDKEGFLWIGTWDGINKFDGQQITSVNSAKALVKNSRIDQIVDDRTYLWIKAYDGVIYRFDKTTQTFASLANMLGTKSKIAVERILAIKENVLWLKTISGGIVAVTQIQKEKPSLIHIKKNSRNGAGLPLSRVNFFYQYGKFDTYIGTPHGVVKITLKTNGQLKAKLLALGRFTYQDFSAVTHKATQMYFGTSSGNLVTLQTANNSFKVSQVSLSKINYLLPAKKRNELFITTALGELVTVNADGNFISKASYRNGGLFSVFEDRTGDLWLEPKLGGIIHFDRERRTFNTYSQKNDASRISPLNHFKVFEDKNGTVWSVLRDGGFGYYDRNAKKFNYFYNEPGSATAKISNLVSTILYDSTGVMFLHTDLRGLDKIVFQNNDFQKKILNTEGVFKSDNDVRALLCDAKNRVWAGARSGVLYVYEQDRRLDITFENLPAGGIGSVYTFLQSKTGAIWFGTKNNGLLKAVPTNEANTSYRLEHYLHHAKNIKSISSNQIYTVAEDHDGNIWAGSYDGGLNVLPKGDAKNGFIRLNHQNYGYPKGFEKIRNMAFDTSGRLWIGSTAGLVICQKTVEGKYSFLSYGNGETLLNYDIQYVFKDHLGKMWLGTSGGGLSVWDGKSPINKLQFSTYTKGRGLDNNYILSISEDSDKQLWVVTKSAISKINTSTGEIQNYNSNNGVPNDGYAEAALIYTKDGKLVVGTIKGVLIFKPSQIKNYPITANLIFTKLQVNNKDVEVGDTQQILTKDINYVDQIFLNHSQNIISIDYTILDFREGNRRKYLYRLKGFDQEWQDNKNQRRATYTNLPPGTYTFEVKSADNEAYIKLPQKSLIITIAPPFWQTWWAYFIYAILLVLVFIMVKRIVTTFLQLRQEIAVEQKMSAMKMSFFTNVSHELRTPLTLILNPVEQILKSKELSVQTAEYAKIIQSNAKRMVHFVNQLLDLRKSQSRQSKLRLSTFSANELMQKITTYFKQETKFKGVDIEIVADNNLQITADADKLETVIHNLLSNALKFASTKQTIGIGATVDQKNGNLLITVKDQGPGVPANDLDTIFQLYHESRNQQTQHIKGTGIGLALARELVELHGGKIWAENLNPQGLAVNIIIPCLSLETIDTAGLFFEESDNEITFAEPLEVDKTTIGELKLAERQSILLVEDNHDMREFLQSLLKKQYMVYTAVDGADGLSKARKLKPDMILSDVMMPNLNGIQMLDTLKNDIATSHIPIILLSAKNALESQIEGLNYGADYYIGKPFDNDFLFAAIESLLKQRKRMFERWISDKKISEVSTDQVTVTARDEQFLHKTITIIEERIADPDLDIDTIAKEVNMSRTAFFIKFKSLTQQAPVEIVRDIRLKVAKQQLDEGAGNISEVSYAVGFSNAKYFSTCFKAAYGLSPTEYLKSIRK